MLKKLTTLALFAATIGAAASTYANSADRLIDEKNMAALLSEAAKHRTEAAVLRAAPTPSETKRPGSPGTALHCERIAARLEAAASAARALPPATFAQPSSVTSGDMLSSEEVRKLIATAKTPAEHGKLARHFAALAARYDADRFNHVAEAKAYRNTPNASETKRPGSPDTATHCERLADAERKAATAARTLANDHERMAK